MPELTREQMLEAALHDCVRLLREALTRIDDVFQQDRLVTQRIESKLSELKSLGLIEGGVK